MKIVLQGSTWLQRLSMQRGVHVLSVTLFTSMLGFSQVASPSKPAALPAPSAQAASAAASANGSALGQPTAPSPKTAGRLAVLPTPLPPALTQGIDVEARSKAILAHLNETIRFFRMSVVPIQKIGEPSDMIYAEQAQATATQVAQLAFQSARGEAALLARVQGQEGAKKPSADAQPGDGETQKLIAAQVKIAQRIQDLQTQNEALDKQIATSPANALPDLRQQKEDVAGQLELSLATSDALAKVSGVTQTNSGLQGDIDQLQHAAPELVDSKIKPVANTLESVGSLRDSGVSSQAVAIFQLLGTRRAIDQQLQETQKLHDQALDLRTPLLRILRATVAAGQKLQSDREAVPDGSTPSPSSASAGATIVSTKKSYDQLTDAFRTISDVSIPVSQEVLLLEQSRGNLNSWRASVDAERATILHSVLLRVFTIALTLGIILVLGEVWRRATARYVQDLRRRRQLLLVRRMVVSFLSGLVVILGFVTQFSSLATFAGFITAGIAVGLQTMLLSVAAYFFIVGRYGIRVGDRITVSGVTGDVVEVGLVRFYLMELTGVGTELHATGRIAVFANSVLFQAGTPLYKQIPGTDYAWHEITVKLKAGADYQPAVDAILGVVEKVYGRYKNQIEHQHSTVESWMDTALQAPGIEARMQFAGGLQYSVRYPVQMFDAGATDEQIVQELINVTVKNEAVLQALDGSPTLTAVIKN